MAIYSYMRVSTSKQSTGRQEFSLDKLGIKFDKAYQDTITGKVIDRPSLNQLKLDVKKGDTVYCESISRLGRNLKDLIEIIEYFNDKGVRVAIVKESIDTTTTTYKLLLGIFGAVAEMERETIQQRTQEGIDKCKETGITKTGNWFGRKQTTKEDLPKNFEKYYNQLEENGGNLTKSEMAKLLKVCRATLYKYIRLYKEK